MSTFLIVVHTVAALLIALVVASLARGKQHCTDEVTRHLLGRKELEKENAVMSERVQWYEKQRRQDVLTVGQLTSRLETAELGNRQSRERFDGDLLLERERYAEVTGRLSDLLERSGTRATNSAPPPADMGGLSPAAREFPASIKSAIEDYSAGRRSVSAHLYKKAAELLAAGQDEEEVALAIRKGDKV